MDVVGFNFLSSTGLRKPNAASSPRKAGSFGVQLPIRATPQVHGWWVPDAQLLTA
jgi:hypothetical protein